MKLCSEKKIHPCHIKTIHIFLITTVILKLISIILLKFGTSYSAILEGYYHCFSIKELIHYITFNKIPTSWPDKNIHSYTYDFSVSYAIASQLNFIANKKTIMPNNIFPYGPLSLIFFYLLSLTKIKTALFLYRTASIILFCTVIIMTFLRKILEKSWLNITIYLFIICLCSTPFSIFIFSGNIESFLFSLILLSLLIKNEKPTLAAVLIATCTAVGHNT
jgi:hypothetical protein